MGKNFLHFIICLVFIFSTGKIVLSQWNPQSFCRAGLNVQINDLSTVKDSINVNIGTGTIITNVKVRIEQLVHSWVSDLSIYLKKDTLGVRLFNKTGGSGDNFIGTVFDDSAAVRIDSAIAPFTGSYRPNQSLAVFNNLFTGWGYWILTITDTAQGDTGNLNEWCIIVSYYFYTGGIQTLEIPNTFRLYQNYPNPFNPVTKIKYGLPKNGYVKLTIYDELGKEVDVLQDGYQQANTYEASFDATNLPSGVYYCKLEADGFSDTKKMVIVK